MMNFKEYISNDISEKKVLIDLLPKNTARRKEKFINTLVEIKDKYQDTKGSLSKFINYKYEKLLPKKTNKNTTSEEKELEKLNELLTLGNPLTTLYEKMGFDLILYDLMHYYDNKLETVNQKICEFITLINEADGNVSLDDFKLNVYEYLYVKNIYESLILKKTNCGNDVYEMIYWKCPKVIEYIIINLRMVVRKNERKINNYVTNKYRTLMKEHGFNEYNEIVERVKVLKNNILEKNSLDEYEIVNMFLGGKLDINSLMNGKDADCNFFMIHPIDLSVQKNYEGFVKTIKTLKFGLEEYLVYLEYKKFLDEFKNKYSKYVANTDKTVKLNETKNKQNEIIKLENKISKLRVNKYMSNIKELENSLTGKDNDKIFEQEILLEGLYKKYTELNEIYFDEKIKSFIKQNTYVSDIFEIYDAYPYFNKKMIKKVFEEENEEEINNIRFKMKDFIYNPHRKIIDMISIFIDKNVPQLLMNGYRFENLNINEESFEDDNINNIFEKCNRIIIAEKVGKFKLSLDEINFLKNVDELKQKDLI